MNYDFKTNENGHLLVASADKGLGGFVISGSNIDEIISLSKLAMQGYCVVECMNYMTNRINAEKVEEEKLKTITNEMDNQKIGVQAVCSR